MGASVNIHFLKSTLFLHSFGSVPWLRTTAPSLRFLRLSLPFFCFQAQIQLDCGEDNICVPDLKLAVYGWEEVIFLWFYLKVLDVWSHTVVSDCVCSCVVVQWFRVVRQISTFHINESRYVRAILMPDACDISLIYQLFSSCKKSFLPNIAASC